MEPNSISDLPAFLDDLKARHLWFVLDRWRPGTVAVTITLVGQRVEVEFFNDHIEYSIFTGDEGVAVDPKPLMAMLQAEVAED